MRRKKTKASKNRWCNGVAEGRYQYCKSHNTNECEKARKIEQEVKDLLKSIVNSESFFGSNKNFLRTFKNQGVRLEVSDMHKHIQEYHAEKITCSIDYE